MRFSGMPRASFSWARASSPPAFATNGSRIGVLMNTGCTELARTVPPALAPSSATVLV